jgi:hypothetical protein
VPQGIVPLLSHFFVCSWALAPIFLDGTQPNYEHERQCQLRVFLIILPGLTPKLSQTLIYSCPMRRKADAALTCHRRGFAEGGFIIACPLRNS